MVACLFSGCGFLEKESQSELFDEFHSADLYLLGYPVTPTDFKDFRKITVAIWDPRVGEGGGFRKLQDGDFVEPEMGILGIKVDPRVVTGGVTEGDEMDQRVFVGDGSNDFIVEALLDENYGYYVCEFNFSDDRYLTFPLLVEVLYPDHVATKRKIVLTTRKGWWPDPGVLPERGLAISLSDEVLDSARDLIGAIAGDGLEISELKPSVISPGILSLGLGSLNVDVALNDTYEDAGGNEVRGLKIEPVGGLDVILDLADAFRAILKLFGLDAIADSIEQLLEALTLGPISLPLGDLLAGFGEQSGDGAGEDTDNMISDLLGNVQLDSLLFVNAFGIPDMTTADFAVIGAALYPALISEAGYDIISEKFLWPSVEIDPQNRITDSDISQITKSGELDVGMIMSQYNLNQMLNGIMNNLEILLVGKSVEAFSAYLTPESKTGEISAAATVNSKGMVIDFGDDTGTTAKLAANDVQLTLLENGKPVSLISLDLAVDIGMELVLDGDDLLLHCVIQPDFELCHFHLLKDSKNISILDHSKAIVNLWNDLTKTKAGEPLVFDLSLSDFGLMPKENPGSIKLENGNCFMNLAVDGFNADALQGLLGDGGGCFIFAVVF